MDKSPDAFRTISEVAVDLDLPQHVLRFWETRFVQIKPLKRGGGRRYYRPDDVELLKGIRHLLYGEGYTIRGVQRILKEQGVRFVMNVWQDGAPQPPATGAVWEGAPAAEEPVFEEDEAAVASRPPSEPTGDDAYAPFAPHRPAPDASLSDPRETSGPVSRAEPHFGAEPEGVAAMAQRFAPRLPGAGENGAATSAKASIDPETTSRVPETPPPPGARAGVADLSADPMGGRASRLPADLRPPEAPETPRAGIGQFFDRLRPGAARDAEPGPAPRGVQSLSRDEIRRLQSTLFELLECKRLLDQVR